MEFHKLSVAEIKGLNAAKRQEVETEIRKELAHVRMDIYSTAGQHVGKVRGLKKSLARLLTIKNVESNRRNPKAKR